MAAAHDRKELAALAGLQRLASRNGVRPHSRTSAPVRAVPADVVNAEAINSRASTPMGQVRFQSQEEVAGQDDVSTRPIASQTPSLTRRGTSTAESHQRLWSRGSVGFTASFSSSRDFAAVSDDDAAIQTVTRVLRDESSDEKDLSLIVINNRSAPAILQLIGRWGGIRCLNLQGAVVPLASVHELVRAIERNPTPIVEVWYDGASFASISNGIFARRIDEICQRNRNFVRERELARARDAVELAEQLAFSDLRGLAQALLDDVERDAVLIQEVERKTWRQICLSRKDSKKRAYAKEFQRQIRAAVHAQLSVVEVEEADARESTICAEATESSQLFLTFAMDSMRALANQEESDRLSLRSRRFTSLHSVAAAQAAHAAQKTLRLAELALAERRSRENISTEQIHCRCSIIADLDHQSSQLRHAASIQRAKAEDEKRRALQRAIDDFENLERLREREKLKAVSKQEHVHRHLSGAQREEGRRRQQIETAERNIAGALSTIRLELSQFAKKVERLSRVYRLFANHMTVSPMLHVGVVEDAPILRVYQGQHDPTATVIPKPEPIVLLTPQGGVVASDDGSQELFGASANSARAAASLASSGRHPMRHFVSVNLTMGKFWLLRARLLREELQEAATQARDGQRRASDAVNPLIVMCAAEYRGVLGEDPDSNDADSPFVLDGVPMGREQSIALPHAERNARKRSTAIVTPLCGPFTADDSARAVAAITASPAAPFSLERRSMVASSRKVLPTRSRLSSLRSRSFADLDFAVTWCRDTAMRIRAPLGEAWRAAVDVARTASLEDVSHRKTTLCGGSLLVSVSDDRHAPRIALVYTGSLVCRGNGTNAVEIAFPPVLDMSIKDFETALSLVGVRCVGSELECDAIVNLSVALHLRCFKWKSSRHTQMGNCSDMACGHAVSHHRSHDQRSVMLTGPSTCEQCLAAARTACWMVLVPTPATISQVVRIPVVVCPAVLCKGSGVLEVTLPCNARHPAPIALLECLRVALPRGVLRPQMLNGSPPRSRSDSGADALKLTFDELLSTSTNGSGQRRFPPDFEVTFLANKWLASEDTLEPVSGTYIVGHEETAEGPLHAWTSLPCARDTDEPPRITAVPRRVVVLSSECAIMVDGAQVGTFTKGASLAGASAASDVLTVRFRRVPQRASLAHGGAPREEDPAAAECPQSDVAAVLASIRYRNHSFDPTRGKRQLQLCFNAPAFGLRPHVHHFIIHADVFLEDAPCYWVVPKPSFPYRVRYAERSGDDGALDNDTTTADMTAQRREEPGETAVAHSVIDAALLRKARSDVKQRAASCLRGPLSALAPNRLLFAKDIALYDQDTVFFVGGYLIVKLKSLHSRDPETVLSFLRGGLFTVSNKSTSAGVRVVWDRPMADGPVPEKLTGAVFCDGDRIAKVRSVVLSRTWGNEPVPDDSTTEGDDVIMPDDATTHRQRNVCAPHHVRFSELYFEFAEDGVCTVPTVQQLLNSLAFDMRDVVTATKKPSTSSTPHEGGHKFSVCLTLRLGATCDKHDIDGNEIVPDCQNEELTTEIVIDEQPGSLSFSQLSTVRRGNDAGDAEEPSTAGSRKKVPNVFHYLENSGPQPIFSGEDAIRFDVEEKAFCGGSLTVSISDGADDADAFSIDLPLASVPDVTSSDASSLSLRTSDSMVGLPFSVRWQTPHLTDRKNGPIGASSSGQLKPFVSKVISSLAKDSSTDTQRQRHIHERLHGTFSLLLDKSILTWLASGVGSGNVGSPTALLFDDHTASSPSTFARKGLSIANDGVDRRMADSASRLILTDAIDPEPPQRSAVNPSASEPLPQSLGDVINGAGEAIATVTIAASSAMLASPFLSFTFDREAVVAMEDLQRLLACVCYSNRSRNPQILRKHIQVDFDHPLERMSSAQQTVAITPVDDVTEIDPGRRALRLRMGTVAAATVLQPPAPPVSRSAKTEIPRLHRRSSIRAPQSRQVAPFASESLFPVDIARLYDPDTEFWDGGLIAAYCRHDFHPNETSNGGAIAATAPVAAASAAAATGTGADAAVPVAVKLGNSALEDVVMMKWATLSQQRPTKPAAAASQSRRGSTATLATSTGAAKLPDVAGGEVAAEVFFDTDDLGSSGVSTALDAARRFLESRETPFRRRERQTDHDDRCPPPPGDEAVDQLGAMCCRIVDTTFSCDTNQLPERGTSPTKAKDAPVPRVDYSLAPSVLAGDHPQGSFSSLLHSPRPQRAASSPRVNHSSPTVAIDALATLSLLDESETLVADRIGVLVSLLRKRPLDGPGGSIAVERAVLVFLSDPTKPSEAGDDVDVNERRRFVTAPMVSRLLACVRMQVAAPLPLVATMPLDATSVTSPNVTPQWLAAYARYLCVVAAPVFTSLRVHIAVCDAQNPIPGRASLDLLLPPPLVAVPKVQPSAGQENAAVALRRPATPSAVAPYGLPTHMIQDTPMYTAVFTSRHLQTQLQEPLFPSCFFGLSTERERFCGVIDIFFVFTPTFSVKDTITLKLGPPLARGHDGQIQLGRDAIAKLAFSTNAHLRLECRGDKEHRGATRSRLSSLLQCVHFGLTLKDVKDREGLEPGDRIVCIEIRETAWQERVFAGYVKVTVDL